MTTIEGRTALSPDDDRHGTVTGYNNHGCRCVLCRDAFSEHCRQRRRRVREATRCPNCGGPGGLFRDNECDACHAYRVRHGKRRTEEVWSPPDRHCANCGRLMEAGEPLRNERCEACAKHRYRYGRERPRRLWGAS